MMNEELRRLLRLKKGLVALLMLLGVCTVPMYAQQYTGMSGLIHVPSADMCPEGEARVGGHFLNKEFVPDEAFDCLGKGKYHTTNHYLSITPFRWIEIGYTCTLMKGLKDSENADDIGFYHKDRFFSIKLRPVEERKWWPSIAIGSNDPVTTESKGKDVEEKNRNQIFSNFYVAATKHFDLQGHSIGLHLAYRKWKRSYNGKWNGTVGGITYQPSFQKNLRLIAEYTGNDMNVGFDWKLWKHLLIQSSLQNGKYFSGGICFCINLL